LIWRFNGFLNGSLFFVTRMENTANLELAIATIDQYTVVGSLTWLLNGGSLVLVQTWLLLLCKSSCLFAN